MIGKIPKIERRAPIGLGKGLRLRAALGTIQRHIRELTEEKEAIRREVDELRQVVAEQTEYLDALAAKVELILSREDDLRAMLLGAHEQLMSRADGIRFALSAELQQAILQQNAPQQGVPHAHAPAPAAERDFMPREHSDYRQLSKRIYYQRLVVRIREVVRTALPPDAIVAVVSKGDEELLELGDARRGWHFPQNEHGAYTGYHPTDSAEAITHLEELREKGAQFLLLPGTAFWWLEHYGQFERHLDGRYRRVWDDEVCIVYELSEPQLSGSEAR